MAKKIYNDEEARVRKNLRQKAFMTKTNAKAQVKRNEKQKKYKFIFKYDEQQILIDKIELQKNKTNYLRKLIRKDMKGDNND